MTSKQSLSHPAFLLAGVALFAATCGNAPTASTPAETNRVVIADPSDRLGSLTGTIRTVVEQARDRAAGALSLDGVTITVTPDPAQAIGGWGVGGFTPNGSTVNLYVDPAYPSLATVLDARLSQMVAHELHHAKRFRGPGYGSTLLEACVSEGLADRFAIELLGTDVPPWSTTLTGADLEAWLTRASAEFNRSNYGHSAWFFGTSQDIPRWTGYAIGYHLVTEYQRQHPGSTAQSLVNTPAAAFRP